MDLDALLSLDANALDPAGLRAALAAAKKHLEAQGKGDAVCVKCDALGGAVACLASEELVAADEPTCSAEGSLAYDVLKSMLIR